MGNRNATYLGGVDDDSVGVACVRIRLVDDLVKSFSHDDNMRFKGDLIEGFGYEFGGRVRWCV